MDDNQMPFCGVYLANDGTLKDLLGSPATDVPNGMNPLNSEFYAADGAIHNLDEVIARFSGGGTGGIVAHDLTLNGSGTVTDPLGVVIYKRHIDSPATGLNDVGLLLVQGATFNADSAWRVEGATGYIEKMANGATVLHINGQSDITLLSATGVWQPNNPEVLAEGMGTWTEFPRSGTPEIDYWRWINSEVLDDGIGQLGLLADLYVNDAQVGRQLVPYLNEIIRRGNLFMPAAAGSEDALTFPNLASYLTSNTAPMLARIYVANTGNTTGRDLLGLMWRYDNPTIYGLFIQDSEVTQDNGLWLYVNKSGDYNRGTFTALMPPFSASEAGKSLTVQADGTLAWV